MLETKRTEMRVGFLLEREWGKEWQKEWLKEWQTELTNGRRPQIEWGDAEECECKE